MIAETLSWLRSNQQTLGVKLIGGAAAFQQAAEKNPAATPACFAFLADENPLPGKFSGTDIQRVDVVMPVVLVVRNVADATGEAAASDLQPLRDAVKTLLLGWVPLENWQPFQRGRGHLMAFRDGHMWWQDIYTSTYFERKP